MDEIHIVLENPQTGQRREHKKRPRLVTSCDNCRMKKLKCIKSDQPNARCEACVHANIPCEFHDREQYLAERSRISKSSSASTSSGSTSPPPYDSRMFYGSPMQSFSNVATHDPSSSSQPHQNTVSDHVTSWPYGVPLPVPPIQEELYPPLFDPKCWQRPNPLCMICFADAFFQNGGDQFGFLYYDEIVRLFFKDELSYLLSTCIAAYGVRYNTIPEFAKIDGRILSNKYIAHAKNLLASPMYSAASLPTLHSLIILAWLESDRLSDFCLYAKLANDMLHTLQAGGSAAVSGADQRVLDQTWSSVNHLVHVASKTPLWTAYP